MRAAEYVRVSTDQQQYSIVNQQAAIAEYADQRDYKIVKTYADPAKSGLDIKHRPGLQRLIDDVVGGHADFQAVLVYDVSRWGRFQDCDEAACYEFLCRRAGITVHYCAEPFPNDGSSASTVLKMVKRMMAAEYLRELSVKVLAGQCRIAAHGFKLGGRQLFGLRRLLVGPDGKPKMILEEGERKSLTTDRVIYTLGPEHEIHLVREIYAMFLDQNLSIPKIADSLNERGLRYSTHDLWNYEAVKRVLTHPNYVGCAVFNRTSVKLKTKAIHNPPDQWVMQPNAFPAIVSQDHFDRVQAKFHNLVHRRSDERLLAELKAYFKTHENTLPLVRVPSMAARSSYVRRFGSWVAACKLVDHHPPEWALEVVKSRRKFQAVRSEAVGQLREAFEEFGIRATPGKWSFRLRGRGQLLIEVARCYTTPLTGHVRWRVRSTRLRPSRSLIVIRLKPGNELVKDWVFFPSAPDSAWGITLADDLSEQSATIHQTARNVVEGIRRNAIKTKV